MFTSFIDEWSLEPAGDPILTRTSRLLPVRWRGLPAMLKVADEPEEKSGGQLMRWWDGHGAAQVYAAADSAILLERSESRRSLFHMAMTGSDDDATRIACRAVAMLHAARPSRRRVSHRSSAGSRRWPPQPASMAVFSGPAQTLPNISYPRPMSRSSCMETFTMATSSTSMPGAGWP